MQTKNLNKMMENQKIQVGRFRLNRLFSLVLMAMVLTTASAAKIVNMRCEYASSPLWVDSTSPRFTWEYAQADKFAQDRYQITVFSTDGGKEQVVWKSPVSNGRQSLARCEIPALKSFSAYAWQVTTWDKAGKASVSPKASFETAFLPGTQWQGKWISDSHDKDFHPAPMLRKRFSTTAGKKIAKARLYTSAAAYGDLSINGNKAYDAVLNPGYTAYDKRNLYSVSDVTSLLCLGENVIAAVLGCGFYNEIDKVSTWQFENARWRGRPRMICDLRITYTDGTEQTVTSDESWLTATGPFIQDNIYSGDTYDARLEMRGWQDVAFDDSRWQHATVVEAPSQKLVAQTMPPIKVERTLSAVDFKSWGDTVFVYDFGENISGFCEITAQGQSGTTLRLAHGEVLKENGRLEQGNIDIYYYPTPELGFQTDVLILGDDRCTFSPRFTYHGFQFVEVRSDRPVKLTRESVKARFFHSAVAPIGRFECSNDLLNRIAQAARRSYLCNLMSIPTDCPQREKNGWTADAYISQELGLLNFDGIKFYEKWLGDLADNQNEQGRISGIAPSSGWGYEDWVSPVWDAALFMVPMYLYEYYGDTRGIELIWPTCVRYMEYLKTRENADGVVTYGNLGDWVFFKTTTPTDYTTSLFYYIDNEYMARFASLIGKDGAEYAAKAAFLKQYLNDKYLNRETNLYANGSQAAQAVALHYGIVPTEKQQAVADNLSSMIGPDGSGMDFGMLGTKTVLRVLSRYGHIEQAMKMALREDMPSWGYWLKRLNTLGEKWDLFANFRDASYNHVFFGDIAAWMVSDIAGINPDKQQPGFSHLVISPHFVSDLDWARAEYRSVNGLIKSEWKRSGKKVALTVTIPANTTATLMVGDTVKELNSGTHKLDF